MSSYSTDGAMHLGTNNEGQELLLCVSRDTLNRGAGRLDVLRIGPLEDDSFMPPVYLDATQCGQLGLHLLEVAHAADDTTTIWTRGDEQAHLVQYSPGVVAITVELLEQLLTDTGWVKSEPATIGEGDPA